VSVATRLLHVALVLGLLGVPSHCLWQAILVELLAYAGAETWVEPSRCYLHLAVTHRTASLRWSVRNPTPNQRIQSWLTWFGPTRLRPTIQTMHRACGCPKYAHACKSHHPLLRSAQESSGQDQNPAEGNARAMSRTSRSFRGFCQQVKSLYALSARCQEGKGHGC
jgi:hypothetical protein